MMPSQGRSQLFEIAQGGALAGQPDGLAFDGDARLHHVLDHARVAGDGEGEEVAEDGDIGAADDGAGPLADFHHAQHGEGAQGFAQHGPADAELGGEFAFAGEAVAGGDGAAEQLLAQEREHFFEAATCGGIGP